MKLRTIILKRKSSSVVAFLLLFSTGLLLPQSNALFMLQSKDLRAKSRTHSIQSINNPSQRSSIGSFTQYIEHNTIYIAGNEGFRYTAASENWPGDGIYLESSELNFLLNNVITNNSENGVSLSNSKNNTLSNSIITNNRDDGVYLWESETTCLFTNNILNNEGGLGLWFSGNSVIRNNNIKNNGEFGIFYIILEIIPLQATY